MTEYHEPKNRAELIAHYRSVRANLNRYIPPVRTIDPPPADAPHLEREMFSLLSIMRRVSAELKIPLAAMRAKDRHRDVCFARQIYCALALRLTYASRPRIGHMVNLSHHSTVMHAIKKVQNTSKMRALVDRLQNELDPTGAVSQAVAAARAAQPYGCSVEARFIPPINLPPATAGGSSPAPAPGASSCADSER